MEILNKIKDLIVKNDIEGAYAAIIENQDEYIENADYWNLRGMLCFKVGEYDAAINCYKISIDKREDHLDSYFNIAYTYILIGEKLKSALYAGISLKYTDDEAFINDIKELYKGENTYSKYLDILSEVKSNTSFNYKNLGLINYIAIHFNETSREYISLLLENRISENWVYIKDNKYAITNKEVIDLGEFIKLGMQSDKYVVVPYDINYIKLTRELATIGINHCFILAPTTNKEFELIEINRKTMEDLKNKDYKRTITLNKFNAADSNIYSLIKYMPEKYRKKYKLNIINGIDVFSLDNIVKVPLISSITVSGFNTFVTYPKFTHNIDVGHGSVILKNCGNMDKKYKNFAFTPAEYEQIDKVCVTSNMNMLIQSAFSAIPEDKYEITGNPRTDTLVLSDGKKNLEKLLGQDLDDKKIIFNMPTFHIHENSGAINGEKFSDAIKIKNFDYDKFDEFLRENNIICISKVHHAEERIITTKTKTRKLENLLFISNDDLDKAGLDLYEILNCADLLITDYSSIYGDFLFMNKPIVFINADIEKYREERGISLEPYDFWTAGPKVKAQDGLETEILKSLEEEDYYREKREELRDVFYKYKDSNSSLRVWDYIDSVLDNVNK